MPGLSLSNWHFRQRKVLHYAEQMVTHGLLGRGRVSLTQCGQDLLVFFARLVKPAADLVRQSTRAPPMIIQVANNRHQALILSLVDDGIMNALAQNGNS